MKEINAGYEIQSRVMKNDTECYVVGYNPENEWFPYVTWLGIKRENEWVYYWGHYCDTLQSALNDLAERISVKRVRFSEPKQVMFVFGESEVCNYGIAFENTLIDLYDGEALDLNDSKCNVKIIDEQDWVNLDEVLGFDVLYMGE